MPWSSKQVVLPLLIGTSLGGLCFGALYLYYKETDQYGSSRRKKRTTIEMKVPKRLVPAVIGRGGAVIKDIEMRTSAKIHFGNEVVDSEDRICYISGLLEEATLAEYMIQQIIMNQPVIETYEMLLPQKFCSTLLCNSKLEIFKSAGNAKVIMEKTRSYIADGKRRIIIKGTAQQIADALCEIEDKLKDFNDIEEQIKIGQSSRTQRGQAMPRNNVTANISEHQVALEDSTSLQEGTKEVYVSASESPSRFWVQIVGASTLELDALVKAMTDYYNDRYNKDLHVLDSLAPGQIVAARFDFDDNWYRGEITFEDNGFYEVYFVDYGDSTLIPTTDILELRTDFLSLRFQAIEFSLANVKPKGHEWSLEACERFRELVHCADWKVLIAKVDGFDERSLAQGKSRREGSPIPRVELFDKIDNQDLNIGKQLVIENLAEFTEVCSSKGSSTISLSRCKYNNSVSLTPPQSPYSSFASVKEETNTEDMSDAEQLIAAEKSKLTNELIFKPETNLNKYTNGKANGELLANAQKNGGEKKRIVLPAGFEDDESDHDNGMLELF